MLGLIITLLIFYLTANAQEIVYRTELYDVLFGDLSTLYNILPSDPTSDDKGTPNEDNPNMMIPTYADTFIYNISDYENNPEMLDYHAITQKANNYTRRWYYHDLQDEWLTGGREEKKKKQQLNRANIQWLLHTRYFVSRAIRQREKDMNDKRFKLGYLFNRLRRLSSEQLKICSTAEYLKGYKDRHLNIYMKLYERIVRLDVDIRDTIDVIRRIYVVPEKYDIMDVTKNT